MTPRFRFVFFLFCVVLTWLGTADSSIASEDIRISPSRITLGGLSYGAKDGQILSRKVVLSVQDRPETLQITEVDLSRAEGIRLKEQTELPGKVELTFEIDTATFTQGQPFGKFLKVPVRLETSLEEFPQVVIPVVAWLSVNETERDFSDFRFKGSRRWQGPWGTPNMAGAVLVPFILLMVGGLGWSWGILRGTDQEKVSRQGREGRKGRILRSMSFVGLFLMGAVAVWLLYLLGHTYSRGSWMALAAGLAVLLIGKGALRWTGLAGAAVFVLVVFTLPAGVDRVGSYAQVEEDKSIGNRFLLWTGALQAMAEHPFRGIGADQYGTVFRREYQTFGHTAENSTAVSDFMTFGAERGIPFLGLSLGFLLFLLYEGFRDRRPWPLVLGAMLASILAASTFSTLWFVKNYQVLFVFCSGGLVLLVAWRLWAAEDRKKDFRILVKRAAYFVVVTTAGMSLMAWLALEQLPTRSSAWEGGKAGAWMVEPTGGRGEGKPLGTILYLGEPKEELPFLAQTTLRPLASQGWRVIWPGPVGDGAELSGLLESIRKDYPDQVLHVAGHGSGGKLAWLAWREASVDPKSRLSAAGCGFLTEELDQASSTEPPHSAFLVYQSLYDDQVSANAAIRAQKGKAFRDMPLNIVLTPEILGRFSKGWQEWVQAVHEHFLKWSDPRNGAGG